MIMG
jgi:hypothetical protein